MAALEVKRRMKGLLMFVPSLVALCGRLMTDPRVSRADKALLAGVIVYALIPFDFIPDMLPFVGQIDDIYLISLTILRLISHTDEAVVREHWRGGGDIVQLAESVASVAPLLLTNRVRHVLTSRIDFASRSDRVSSNQEKYALVARLKELLNEE